MPIPFLVWGLIAAGAAAATTAALSGGSSSGSRPRRSSEPDSSRPEADPANAVEELRAKLRGETAREFVRQHRLAGYLPYVNFGAEPAEVVAERLAAAVELRRHAELCRVEGEGTWLEEVQGHRQRLEAAALDGAPGRGRDG